jgi:hypothetical protein
MSQLQPMKEKTSITSDTDISEPEISLSEWQRSKPIEENNLCEQIILRAIYHN